MCEFASFVILPDATVRVGNLMSHLGIEKGWGLKPGSYREAEWTEDDDGKTLMVRVSPEDIQEGRNEAWWKSLILAKHPNRENLLSSLTIGKRNGGDVYYFRDGKYHRENDPAIEWVIGHKEWWLNGKRHRENGPAIEWENGDKEWYLNDQLHREDGPAIEHYFGHKQWFLHGMCLQEKEFLARIKRQKQSY